MRWQTYKPGDVIFHEGEESNAAYLIVSGTVRIVKGSGSNGWKKLAIVGAGEYIGEMGAIDNQARSASAVAEGVVVCAPVTPADFTEMLRNDPDEAIGLLKVLFERLRSSSKHLLHLEQAGPPSPDLFYAP